MQSEAEPFEIRTQIVNDYLYSYGGVSPFFRALVDDQTLWGTRCDTCGTVYCPPRTRCGACYERTAWLELPLTGTVISAVDCYYVPPNYELHEYLDMPYTLALVKLDGADTALYNTVYTGDPRLHVVKPGDRVAARFRERRSGRLTDFYFVAEEATCLTEARSHGE